ncbi:hypothetical protein CALVIDRAFT_191277 [Calocera viscosa TUFC12733]|uniref:Uncharacterized protein n=1 Tax=Calocera viscosa (strain TUFC12733) TaxID=1330018 RepID=A0A167KN55_CALVF|nr:hypothetical protein CALVIDRAFT_191277 [Calocera viscosa TUFC12733]
MLVTTIVQRNTRCIPQNAQSAQPFSLRNQEPVVVHAPGDLGASAWHISCALLIYSTAYSSSIYSPDWHRSLSLLFVGIPGLVVLTDPVFVLYYNTISHPQSSLTINQAAPTMLSPSEHDTAVSESTSNDAAQAPPPYMPKLSTEHPAEASQTQATSLLPLALPQVAPPEKGAYVHKLRVLSASNQTSSDPGPSQSFQAIPTDVPSGLAKQNGVRIRRQGDVRESFVIDPSLHAPQGSSEKALDIQTMSEKGVVDARVYLVDAKAEVDHREQHVEMSVKASSVRMTIVSDLDSGRDRQRSQQILMSSQAHATANHRVKLHLQTHKPRAGVRRDMLEVYLCPNLRVDLEVQWAAPCFIKLPPNFTGKVDMHVGRKDTITIEDALKPRTRILNEERGVQLLWIGEFTPGKDESEFDRCFIRTQGAITLGVWEQDPELEMGPGAVWMPEGTGGEVLAKLKSVTGRMESVRLVKSMFGPKA